MFTKAERNKAKLRLAIDGPSGSGKTLGALKIATGMGGKIAVIDTENGSASFYANEYNFNSENLLAPFSPSRYVDLIKAAEKEHDIIIIDSLTHAWNCEGGVLDTVTRLNNSSSNSGWRIMGPEQNRLVQTIIQSPAHIISTIRSKTEYSYEKDEKGKIVPKKIGLAPVQRDGIEYEFTIVLDVSQSDHLATVSKKRGDELFTDNLPFLITEDTGKDIMRWLNTGKDIIAEQSAKLTACKTLEELKDVFSASNYNDPTIVAVKDEMKLKLTNQP
jgi:hypothetical protein